MKHSCKFLFLLLIPFFSTAQSNYKAGYVVTLKGDTIYGFVDYKEWDKNPRDIHFKTEVNTNNIENFSAENSIAFAVTGFEYYEKYKVSVSLDRTEVERLSNGLDTSTALSSIFMKLVIRGTNVNLYEYKDDIKNRFYIKEQKSAKPEELIFRSYLNPTDVNQIVSQPRFKNQLHILAVKYGHNNGKLEEKTERAEYNKGSLVAVVNDINGDEKQDNGLQGVSPVRLFAGIGLNKSNLNYSGNIALALNASSKSSYGPRLDFGIDAFLNPNVGRLLLRAELSFTTASLQVNSNAEAQASQSFKQFNTTLTPQLIYNIYNAEALKLCFGAGISINFATNSDNVYHYAQEPFSGTKAEVKDFPNLTSDYVSFMIRAGAVLHKRYELYMIYTPPAGVTDHYGSFSGTVTTLQAGVNYLW